MLPEKIWGSIITVAVVSICPSVLLSIHWSLSEIDIVDNRCSLKQGLVEQGHSGKFKVTRIIFKGIQFQHFFMSEVHISSEIYNNGTYTLLGI
jgi:hypothetical protein